VFPGYLFVTAVLSGLLALSIVPRLGSAGALPFFGVLMGIALYSLGYALELITPPGGPNALWNHLQYLGSAAIPAFWIWLAIETPRPDRLPGPALPVALLLIPAVTIVLNLTNDLHHLYYRSAAYETFEGLTRARLVPGPWYYVEAAFTVGSFGAGIALYLRAWLRHGAGSPSRHFGVVLATLPTLAAYLLYEFTDVGRGFDLIPLGLSVTAFLFFWLLWPFGLYDLRPVTREAVFHLVSDPVVVLDQADRLVDWNPAAARVFPLLGERKGTPTADRVFAGLPDWLDALKDPDPSRRPVLSLPRPGPSWWALNQSPVVDRRGRTQARVVLLHEQTELVRRAEGLEQLAQADPLTGCLNRRGFLDRAEAARSAAGARGAPASLLAIDLDHFKALNDRWGHPAGDAALRHSVGVWQSQLRSGDVLGRTGGEEFAVFLPGIGPDAAQLIAQRLCDRLRSGPLAWEGASVPVTASLGVSGSPDASRTSVEALLRNADAALYEAKEQGRNRVVLGRLSTEPDHPKDVP